MKGSRRREWREEKKGYGMEMENEGGGRRGGWGNGAEEMDGEEGWREREVVRWLRRMEVGDEGGRRG